MMLSYVSEVFSRSNPPYVPKWGWTLHPLIWFQDMPTNTTTHRNIIMILVCASVIQEVQVLVANSRVIWMNLLKVVRYIFISSLGTIFFSPRNILCPIESVFICLALANTVKSNLKKYSVLFFSDMMSSELEKKRTYLVMWKWFCNRPMVFHINYT